MNFKFHGIMKGKVDPFLAHDGNAAFGNDSMRRMAKPKRDGRIPKLILEASQLILAPGRMIGVHEAEAQEVFGSAVEGLVVLMCREERASCSHARIVPSKDVQPGVLTM